MDTISVKKRSKIMSSIRSKHTSPEIKLRKALRLNGVQYRLHYGHEKIDIALPRNKLALFVDGCFWHGCPIHGHKPKSNRHYWFPKLKKNKQRDRAKVIKLEKNGWRVIRFWEHDINLKISDCIKKINKFE